MVGVSPSLKEMADLVVAGGLGQELKMMYLSIIILKNLVLAHIAERYGIELMGVRVFIALKNASMLLFGNQSLQKSKLMKLLLVVQLEDI